LTVPLDDYYDVFKVHYTNCPSLQAPKIFSCVLPGEMLNAEGNQNQNLSIIRWNQPALINSRAFKAATLKIDPSIDL